MAGLARSRHTARRLSLGNSCDDVLLKEVSHAFARLTTMDLPPLLVVLSQDPWPEPQALFVKQVLLLEWRSRDVREEFAEFYCVRLLLDDQSPLATYFIDLFSQLQWMLEELLGIYFHLEQPRPLSLHQLYLSVRPAIHTCRLLYATYRMLPKSRTLQGLDEQTREGTKFKREGRHDRRFSRNEFHCRMRGFGFVNLDGQGKSKVTLQEKLGEGGFAKVYKGVFEARDELNSRTIIGDPVAVKMFSNDTSDYTKFGCNFGSQLLQSMEHMTQPPKQCMTGIIDDDRLSFELRRLVSARHPNIVTPRGYIGKRPQGESGLVMEFMDESLHDYLEKVNNGSLPPLRDLESLDLMLEIAKGMRFLHECNLIHRDLKPQNVLLRYCADHENLGCKFLNVKLADFGLAKLCDFAQGGSTMYRQTSFRGTSCYMAPELRGDAPSQESSYELEKVDVFSYGTTCFNIITGTPNALAFSSQSVKKFYEAVKTGEWKQWVQGLDKRLHFFVKLIARFWEPEAALRPSFATVCVLLQHTMQFSLSALSLHTISMAVAQVPTLHKLQKDFKLQYSEIYRSIITHMLSRYLGVGGVKVITRFFRDFESTVLAHPNRFLIAPMEIARWIASGIFCKEGSVSNVAEISDFAQDVSIFVEAIRKGHFDTTKTHGRNLSFFYNLMDSVFDKSDPLLFIKGVACFNFLKFYQYQWETCSLSSKYPQDGFDFKNDEAFCELEVDTSLIPLLVSFWTLVKL